MKKTVHTIVLYPKLQIDTLLALFLLRKFGEKKIPGVSNAKLEFWNRVPEDKTAKSLEKQGYLLIDFEGAFFDHHEKTKAGRLEFCVSEIVASCLDVKDDPALKKLLAFARRDDLQGRGIISKDALDRAFGLSGIVMNFNRFYSGNLDIATYIVLEIFEAHYFEEYKRQVLMPKEWKDLKRNGKTREFSVKHKDKNIRIVQFTSENRSLPGFLRAYIHADMVIARLNSGHVNIITGQFKKIDLRKTIAYLRYNEVKKKDNKCNILIKALQKPGLIRNIPEWVYDTAANTIQNGGIEPGGVPATGLSDNEIKNAVERGLVH